MHIYFVLHRTYESFLKLNPILEEHGYIFEAYGYYEFHSRFSRMLSHGLVIEDRMDLSSLAFTHPTFDFYTTGKRPMILLRSIDHMRDKMAKLGLRVHEVIPKEYEFIRAFINTLRLYKSGMIQTIMHFTYDAQTKEWGESGYDSKHKSLLADEYIIEDEDVLEISRRLKNGIRINDLSRLAFDSFNLSYTLENKSLKFITLITALESLFNISRDQIAHTVSRHLSILISTTKEEFYERYKSMKKLYDFRSKIVHGNMITDKEIDDKLSELEELVRRALNKTIAINLNKESLFKELNARGFS